MSKFYHLELSNISPNAKIGKDCIVHSHVIIYDDVIISEYLTFIEIIKKAEIHIILKIHQP